MNVKQFLKKQLRRILREFVDNVDAYTTLSKKSVGFIVRTLHATIPVMALLISAVASKLVCVLNITGMAVVCILFFLFDGCLLTKLEFELCEDNFTVIDPVLELLRIEVTTPNRVFITRVGFLLYVIMLPLIYYGRFIIGGSVSNNISATLNFGISI